jgi:hypothetical protein
MFSTLPFSLYELNQSAKGTFFRGKVSVIECEISHFFTYNEFLVKLKLLSMKKINILVLVASTLLLGGCQNMLKTMVAHIRISNTQTEFIANGNAYTNFCMSKNLIDRQTAHEFSTVAAEMLDLVVFDNDRYKSTYENAVLAMDANYKRDSAGAAPTCEKIEGDMPKVIADLRTAYNKYAGEPGVARSEENKQLAQSMSNFQLPSTPMPQIPQMNFPNVGYSQLQSPSQNFLVNTKSGITQCRVTRNNFVFCL